MSIRPWEQSRTLRRSPVSKSIYHWNVSICWCLRFFVICFGNNCRYTIYIEIITTCIKAVVFCFFIYDEVRKEERIMMKTKQMVFLVIAQISLMGCNNQSRETYFDFIRYPLVERNRNGISLCSLFWSKRWVEVWHFLFIHLNWYGYWFYHEVSW